LTVTGELGTTKVGLFLIPVPLIVARTVDLAGGAEEGGGDEGVGVGVGLGVDEEDGAGADVAPPPALETPQAVRPRSARPERLAIRALFMSASF
jgi:hypothetical protein